MLWVHIPEDGGDRKSYTDRTDIIAEILKTDYEISLVWTLVAWTEEALVNVPRQIRAF
jgi:hypothetical protein